jgi:Mce-associated membrane protein
VVAAPAARDGAGVTADHDEDSTTDGRPGSSGGLRAAMAAVLVLLLVAAVAVGIWGYTRLSAAEDELEARSAVVRVAESFMVQFNTYDPEGVDEYVESVNELLSTSAKTTFGKQLEDITTLIRETELESEGKVHASGVASLDQDSARVLVVADAEATSASGPVQRHFRWEISLVQVDGEWLVDDFEPVA